MGLKERLADPWAAVVGAVAGGLTWAVVPAGGVGIAAGAGVAVVVYGAKVVSDALLNRSPATAQAAVPVALPEPPRGSSARRLLDRAEEALRALDGTVENAAAGVTRDQIGAIRDTASSASTQVRRLAGQATAFDQACGQIPVERLREERGRLQRARPTDPAVREEQASALRGVTDQLATYDRMTAARDAALARLHSTAVGLEGLRTRAVELLALAATTGEGPGDELVEELGAQLDALRAGLDEVSRLASGGPSPGAA
ncbi:hypothetical protein [Pseudonocardia oroxyli]|uniref:Uncharacterized protein n=1 Tax=Pseudonocardia oroxyli TaxID=366584 RepID=A0A1G7G6W7_PSEOR|nr:hypothetical protein [Pseudonocardia oroxyli]SDE83779.1 hypothetical protein SAMN05216377_102235 [Pseudonocardia oroxyli]